MQDASPDLKYGSRLVRKRAVGKEWVELVSGKDTNLEQGMGFIDKNH